MEYLIPVNLNLCNILLVLVVNGRQPGSNFLRQEVEYKYFRKSLFMSIPVFLMEIMSICYQMGGTSTMLEVNKRIKKFLQDPTKME